MTISGDLLIGSRRVPGGAGTVRGRDAATGAELEPPFAAATEAQLAEVCALAEEAFDPFRSGPTEQRARLLELIADKITAIGDALIERCMAETGLPRARLEGERARTVGQLRLFASVVRAGDHLDLRIDPALPDRKPLPRPDLRLRNIPLGPVVVFGASNFPLAFSVAGGDTASALAAGCPVIVKAHPAHPGTSVLVGEAVQAAVAELGLPDGVFSLVFTDGPEASQELVRRREVMAVGFTGSRRAGLALMRAAASREVPIPVYAEMSSVNPVLLMPGALRERGAQIAPAFATSLVLGAGQFCTNPGLLLAEEGGELDSFVAAAADAVRAAQPATMLTRDIWTSFGKAVEELDAHPAVTTIARGAPGAEGQGQAALFSTTAEAFLAHPDLQNEIFGASSLLVRCRNASELRRVVQTLEGQLTVAVHMAPTDRPAVDALLPLLERKAGRILVNGFGTGVEVSHAMVHGGPFPATSDGRSTSVGTMAIRRFLRPVCYQDLPDASLPPELQEANPLGLRRLVDGAFPA
jgi:2,5-dioxopentanoate dehydrogenase